jgi:hypothetical protein
MFDPISRYAQVETVQLTLPDGRTVAYKRRRFLPQGRQLPLLEEVTVVDGNDAMQPRQLTEESNQTLRVPMPQV